MRKYRYLAVAVGAATVLSVSAGAAVAASANTAASKPVLTVGKASGPAVKHGAKLFAGLEKGSKVTFSIGTNKATCSSASFSATAVKNPAAKGKATLSITSESIAKCPPIKVLGISATVSLKAINLPYVGTVSTAKGDPVVIAGSKKSKPTGFDATVKVSGVGTLTCVFTAASATGHASNKHNTVAFSGQTFTLNAKASSSDCSLAGTKASFSATFGPVVDKSVKHSPAVFVS
jgi:hypothetical protein